MTDIETMLKISARVIKESNDSDAIACAAYVGALIERLADRERELRAERRAAAESARARVRELDQLRAILNQQIIDANVSLLRAEREAEDL